MDQNDPTNPSDKPPTPDDRLRRILNAREDDEHILITGGVAPIDPVEPPTDPLPENRHPTGQPDSTGGWAESGAEFPSADAPDAPTIQTPAEGDSSQAETIILPPEPAATDIPTQPVKVRPAGNVTTVATPAVGPVMPSARPTAHPRPPAIVPGRVDEIDSNATRVTPAAYGQTPPNPTRRAAQSYNANIPPAYRPAPARPATPPPPSRPVKRPRPSGKRGMGCLLRGIIAMLFIGALALLCVGSYGVYRYFAIASTLPSVDDLRNRASKFETTRILDRNGNVLYEILDPTAGRRTYVPLDKISPNLIAATIGTEDKDFWNHPGFDPVAIARALWRNYTTGDGGGASTITQQLARTLLLTPQERAERTVQRKAREIILAAEITRRYSKNDILELYLNEIYYGNLSYGAEAASEIYFNTSSSKLSLAQASFLAGLPQAPGVYDIFQNREATLGRQKQVLTLMYDASQNGSCIDVGAQAEPVCVDVATAQQAAKEIENYPFKKVRNNIRYPHWVTYIRAQLEEQFDAQTIYRSGFTVKTTLDPVLQDQAQEIVKQQVDALADRHVTDGALVSIRPSSGEILAMVGSADFYNDEISGQVNMAVSPRQPGSSIKPLTYVAAFEKGWTPATLIWDVPSEFPPSGDPNDPREPYRPENYDGRFHGPVTVRTALANSFNIPAVKTLQFVGIYDDPNTAGQDGLVNFARRLGITTLNRPDYGLSLTLGGGDVSVLELTDAFAVFANNGVRIPPVSITRITDYTGAVVYEYQPPEADQVVRPEHAYLISSILSDNEARSPMFGPNSVLNLPFQVAAKTGTTNDFRDNWTLGYTPDLATGVWVGNADYTPMVNTTGVTGAAPIWSQFMQFAVPTITGGNPTPFNRPPGIVDKVICAVSGTEPSEYCPTQRNEIFAADQLPLPKDKDLWQKVNIDTWTGLKASAACNDFTSEKFSLNVNDKFAQQWIRDTEEGQAWASEMGFQDTLFLTPSRDCKLEDPRPMLIFAALTENQAITSPPLDIYAVINATQNFKSWRLQWGIGKDPSEWKNLVKSSDQQYQNPEKIFTWDMADVPTGKTITLRLYMTSTKGTFAERKITLRNMIPTPTNAPTATETEIPTGTPEPTSTETPIPTELPTETQVPLEPTVQLNPTETSTPESGIGILLPPFLRHLFDTKTPEPTLTFFTPVPQIETTAAPLPENTIEAPLPVEDTTTPQPLGSTETSTQTATATCEAQYYPSPTGTLPADWQPVLIPCRPTATPTPSRTPSATATSWLLWFWPFR